ncbi:MAG: hypothetical protein JWL98_1268 [Xanthomonadaceae bacterium]|nr:hypothetical protein [Xanthomonadaceae bacterium]
MNSGSPPAPRRVTRSAWIALALLVLALLAAIALRTVMQPQHATRLILDQVGRALGLQLTASGTAEYSLRGTPTLTIRNVIAREPGARTALLRADRIHLALPWSTIRQLANGPSDAVVIINRVELDRPIVDVEAMQHWLAHRPPSKAPLPTLTEGMLISDGTILGTGWSLKGLAVDIPMLAATQPFKASTSGRYVSSGLQVPFEVHVALSRPANDARIGVAGQVTIERDTWRMPSQIVLSGDLHTSGDWRLHRAKLAAASSYDSGKTHAPFTMGIAGELHSDNARLALDPAGVVVHGKGAIPDLVARGTVAVSSTLDLRLDGAMPAWPAGWPDLPAPVGTSQSPLAFGIRYAGKPDLSDAIALQLHRDATQFEGRLQLSRFSTWIGAAASGSPIPPLVGRVTAPQLDIAGATLQGVTIDIDDADTQPAAAP